MIRRATVTCPYQKVGPERNVWGLFNEFWLINRHIYFRQIINERCANSKRCISWNQCSLIFNRSGIYLEDGIPHRSRANTAQLLYNACHSCVPNEKMLRWAFRPAIQDDEGQDQADYWKLRFERQFDGIEVDVISNRWYRVYIRLACF